MTERVGSPRVEQPNRRELILDAAILLFREHGFDATGIDEIGAAAGVTGPAVYRHFESKQHILDEAVRLAATEVLDAEQRILEQARPDEETIDLLIADIVEQVLDSPSLIAGLLRERANLSAEGIRNWNRWVRAYLQAWVGPLPALRPKLSDRVARTSVFAAMGMVTTIAQSDDRLDRAVLAPRLRGMLHAAILAEPR